MGQTYERKPLYGLGGEIMLSKSAARAFFLIGTVGFSVIFLLLTLDTIRRVPEQTNAANLTP
jgi:nitric oxide reductase subunit C